MHSLHPSPAVLKKSFPPPPLFIIRPTTIKGRRVLYSPPRILLAGYPALPLHITLNVKGRFTKLLWIIQNSWRYK